MLINSAGIVSLNSIENIDLTIYDRDMNVNVRSMIELTKLAVPHLEKTKGNVLNVSGLASLRTTANFLMTSISKAAVNQLTKCAALDLSKKGIRVNAIVPGATRTPLFERALGMTSQQAEKFFESFKDQNPLGRVGEVTDTTAAIEYLISDSASFITGSLFAVDGGALIS